jgi:hypothetical protein
MEQEDGAAIAPARDGDRDAFRALVERHGRTIFRLAFRMTANEQDAEDIVQGDVPARWTWCGVTNGTSPHAIARAKEGESRECEPAVLLRGGRIQQASSPNERQESDDRLGESALGATAFHEAPEADQAFDRFVSTAEPDSLRESVRSWETWVRGAREP